MKRSKLSIALGLAMIPMVATAASQSDQKFVDEKEIMSLLGGSFDSDTEGSNNFDATEPELQAHSEVSDLYLEEPQVSEDGIRPIDSVNLAKETVYMEAVKKPIDTSSYVFDKPMEFETGVDAIEKNDTYRQKLNILELEAAMLEKQLEMVEMKASIKEVTDNMNRDAIRGVVRAEEKAVFDGILAEKEAEFQSEYDRLNVEITTRDDVIAERVNDIEVRDAEIAKRDTYIESQKKVINGYVEKIKELENKLLYGTEDEPEDDWMMTEEMFALGSIRGKRNDPTALVYFEDYELHLQSGDYILGDKNAQVVKVNTDNVILRIYEEEYVLVPLGNTKAAQWARQHAVDDSPEVAETPAPTQSAGPGSFDMTFNPSGFDPLSANGFSGAAAVNTTAPSAAYLTDPSFTNDPMSNPAALNAIMNTNAPALPDDPMSANVPMFGATGFAQEVQ